MSNISPDQEKRHKLNKIKQNTLSSITANEKKPFLTPLKILRFLINFQKSCVETPYMVIKYY